MANQLSSYRKTTYSYLIGAACSISYQTLPERTLLLDKLLTCWLNSESRHSRATQPKRDVGECCDLCSVSPYAAAAEFPVYLPHDVTHFLVLQLTAFEMNTMDIYKDEHLQDLLVDEPTPDDPYELGDVDRQLFLSEYEAAFIALLCAEIRLRRQDVWFAVEQVMLGVPRG